MGAAGLLKGAMVTVLMVVQTKPQNKETTMLNTNEKIIKHKVGLLNLAEELGNVDLSRFSAAPSSHLSGKSFKCQGAFPA